MGRLIVGDNLKIMREIPDASVDLICTDPPFNTGRDWGAFNDKWEGGIEGYLKFMEPRIEEMHRLLKDTGSFYLHCDTKASHYLKVMLDGVFGVKQFRNAIIWRRCPGQANNTRRIFPQIHDTLLFYTKRKKYVFNTLYLPLKASTIQRYDKVDEDGRRYYEYSGGKRSSKARRYYLDESKGRALTDLWAEGPYLTTIHPERLGYPTQKPRALYEQMIKISSNEGDLVLDPFCGSGTTLDAAEVLGRQWIGIDLNSDAIAICESRLNDTRNPSTHKQ